MKRRVHLKTQPVYLKKLIDSTGIQGASTRLGVTCWAINRHIANNETSIAIETAAKFLLGETEDKSTAVIQADNETLRFVKNILEKSNGHYTDLK